jgi:hypothetical protein
MKRRMYKLKEADPNGLVVLYPGFGKEDAAKRFKLQPHDIEWAQEVPTIRNFTGRDIMLHRSNGSVWKFPPEGHAQAHTRYSPADLFINLPCFTIDKVEEEGIPKPEEGVRIIASTAVKETLKHKRNDLIAPIMPVRREGVIIGCRGFSVGDTAQWRTL